MAQQDIIDRIRSATWQAVDTDFARGDRVQLEEKDERFKLVLCRDIAHHDVLTWYIEKGSLSLSLSASRALMVCESAGSVVRAHDAWLSKFTLQNAKAAEFEPAGGDLQPIGFRAAARIELNDLLSLELLKEVEGAAKGVQWKRL